MGTVTHGLVCAHHHLYSALARGMPAPPAVPTDFIEVLRNVWWRLDSALDLDIIHWSAALGAAEAVFGERHFPTADALRRSARALGLEGRATVRPGDVLLWAKRLPPLPPSAPWLRCGAPLFL